MERVKLRKAGGSYFTAPKDQLEFIKTGCHLLDLAMGGGWVEGRIGNIVGDKSTGKTLLCIEAAVNFILKYPKGTVMYREAEAAFDKGYAQALGMPMDRIDFGDDISFETVEDLFEDLERVCKRKHKQPVLYICDSLDALSDRAEMARDMDEGTYGAQKAKALSQMFRRLVRMLEKTNVTVIIVSQVRDNIGAVGFQKKTKRSGGHALDFYATHVLELANLGKIPIKVCGLKRIAGVKVKGYVAKNKVALPYREAEFSIKFGYGTDDALASLQFLKTVKGLKAAGYDSNVMTEKEVAQCAEDASPKDLSAINKVVTTFWYDIEKEFMPTRRKYEPVP